MAFLGAQLGAKAASGFSEKFGFTQHPFFGNNPRAFDQAKALGLGSVRITLPWAGVELEPFACSKGAPKQEVNSNCRWGTYGLWIEEAAAKGLKVAVMVLVTPEWARDPNFASCKYPHGIPPSQSVAGASEPFEAFMTAAAKHFRGKVEAWLLWSEVDTPANWCGGPELYRNRILKPGATAVKNADPTALIVAPGLYIGKQPLTAAMFDRWLTDDGNHLAAPIDAIAVDGYRLSPNLSNDFSVLSTYHRCTAGPSRHCTSSFWITEFGFGTLPSCPPGALAQGEDAIASHAWTMLRSCAENSHCGKAFYWTISTDSFRQAREPLPCQQRPQCDFALTEQCSGFSPRQRYFKLQEYITRYIRQ